MSRRIVSGWWILPAMIGGVCAYSAALWWLL